jgi:hypothetical protein
MAKPIHKEGGLSETAIRRLSAGRKEPAWLLDIRLSALAALKRLPAAGGGHAPSLTS